MFRWSLQAQPCEGFIPSHPPLSCRTSPPQGGRLAVTKVGSPHRKVGRWRNPAHSPASTRRHSKTQRGK
ncbi:MAG: hypothetical protein EOQ99_21660 [Mesorhizobium sp.]|nr:MAG: hypothetical protein EOQ99_21660 [Mesorhizobium sp.]